MSTAENPPYGIATYLGIAAAAVQYVTALVILLAGGPTEAAIGALGTATLALVGVLTGRYAQAAVQIKAHQDGITAARVAEIAADKPETVQPVVKVHLDGKEIASAVQRDALAAGVDDDEREPADDLPPALGDVPANREPDPVEVPEDWGDQESASAQGASEEVQDA